MALPFPLTKQHLFGVEEHRLNKQSPSDSWKRSFSLRFGWGIGTTVDDVFIQIFGTAQPSQLNPSNVAYAHTQTHTHFDLILRLKFAIGIFGGIPNRWFWTIKSLEKHSTAVPSTNWKCKATEQQRFWASFCIGSVFRLENVNSHGMALNFNECWAFYANKWAPTNEFIWLKHFHHTYLHFTN